MIGGFLKGALTGTIVAGLLAGTASVLTDPPARYDPNTGDAPQAGAVEVPPGSGFDARRQDRAARLPDPDTRPEGVHTPQVPRPARAIADIAAPDFERDTAPKLDATGDMSDTLVAPAPDGDSGGIATRGDRPVVPDPPPVMPDAAKADPPAPPATTAVNDADAPALRRNAEAFVNPRGKPLMAIVLMEAAGSTVKFETLESFPYPLSIALDPQRRGATEAAARYRAAGFEVLLTVDLAPGAAPADTRMALQSRLSRVPVAVAVLTEAATGLPAGAAPILAQTGHGLVSREPQAGPARQLLSLAAVPAVVLQRDLDGQGQTVEAIRDGLDQAAKAADTQQGVIVLARMRADTLRALSLWSGQGGARQVTLAPVSAVLSGR